MRQLLITIIVPCYNVARYIKDNFHSLTNQDLQLGSEYEIIYIDDKSSDTTYDVLETLRQDGVRVYQNEKNIGVSHTRNRGIELAKGELLWFIDSDDFIAPNILGELLKLYHSAPDAIGVNIHAAAVSFDSTPNYVNRTTGWSFNYNACNYIVSREYVLSNNIRFPSNINSGEDQLFVFQEKYYGGLFLETEKIIYYYRMNPSSLTHSSNHEKHMDNMEAMLDFYHNFMAENNEKGTKFTKANLLERMQWSSANICADAVYLPKDRATKVLEKLKAEGNYPFPILWKRLTLKYGWKVWLINCIRLPLCYRWYFMLMNRLLHKN